MTLTQSPNSKTNLQTRWTSHLKTKQDRDGFTKNLLLNSGTDTLKRLKKILREDYNSLETLELKEEDLDSPGWAVRQAYLNGKKRQIRDMLSLLNFVQDT